MKKRYVLKNKKRFIFFMAFVITSMFIIISMVNIYGYKEECYEIIKINSGDTLWDIAERYNKTAAQVIIRWHLQRGVIVLPKTQTKERIKENIEVFDFELSDDDMNLISSLNDETCYGAHPDTFDF